MRQQPPLEFRIMPNGGDWYWEVIAEQGSVVCRGVSDTEPAACKDAADAARAHGLLKNHRG
jgi:hypothetical protein